MKGIELSTLKDQLADSSRKIADLTAAMVYENPSLIEPLLELTWMDDEPWSQRASRIISICSCEFPELFVPFASEVIHKLKSLKSEGARRNFLKVFMEQDFPLKSQDKSILLDVCFCFLEGNYSVSVKVYSMDIIFKLSKKHPEIRRELREILFSQMEDSSAGYRSRAGKLIKKMENPVNFRKSKNAADR